MLNIYRMLIAQMAKIFLRFPPSNKKILPPLRKISRSPNWAGISLHPLTIYGKPRSFWPIFFAEVT